MYKQRECKDAIERAWTKIMFNPESDCLLWMGALSDYGYPIMTVGIRADGSRRATRVHRLFYEHYKGPIPPGKEPDHLCRVRCCVNPEHMEAVTRRENTLRGIGPAAQYAKRTRCNHGHEFTLENTLRHHGNRYCRICAHEYDRKRYLKKKAGSHGR